MLRKIESAKTKPFSFRKWIFYKELASNIATFSFFGLAGVWFTLKMLKGNEIAYDYLNLIPLFLVGFGALWLVLDLSLQEREIKRVYYKENLKALSKTGNRRSLRKIFILLKRYHKESFKQWIVVTLIGLGVFLPVRLVFWNYVSHSWLGNLGVMSAIAFTLFLLIHYNKIGIIGKYFRNKITRIVFSRIGVMGLIISMFYAMMWGSMLFLIDKAEFDWKEDRNLFFAELIYSSAIDDNWNLAEELTRYEIYPEDQYMIQMGYLNSTQRNDMLLQIVPFGENDFIAFTKMMSFILMATNLEYGAWGSHFATVFMIEEIEAVALFFFYRKAYFRKDGEGWTSLGLYNSKRIKKFAKERF